MHNSSMLRMGWFVNFYKNLRPRLALPVPAPDNRIRVLDVGSCDVNGYGGYRKLFDEALFAYTGLDIEPGPNVDLCPRTPYAWNEIEAASFDIVISGQALEHIEFFWLTMLEIARVLKHDGVACLVAPRELHRHRHPVDCYRFEADGMLALARYSGLVPLHVSTNLAPKGAIAEWYQSQDSMLIAIKPKNWTIPDMTNYKCVPGNLEELASGFVSKEENGF